MLCYLATFINIVTIYFLCMSVYVLLYYIIHNLLDVLIYVVIPMRYVVNLLKPFCVTKLYTFTEFRVSFIHPYRLIVVLFRYYY